MKFKVGDRVKVVKNFGLSFVDSEIGKVGKIVSVIPTFFYPYNIEDVGYSWRDEELQKVGGSMESVDDLQVGDILVNSDGDERKVLGICGLVALLSITNVYNNFR